jgi:transposase
MTAEERIASLEAQLSQMREQWEHTQEALRQAQEELAAAYKRIEELEKQKSPPPAFVKANVKKPHEGPKPPRKKRDPKYNHARRREAPTRIVEHRIRSCPVCSSRLGGVSVARRRQVLELPPPPPIEVTEHVIYHGWCSQCGTWREAAVDVSREVVGQGRIGVKLTSVIAYLRTVMRLPIRQIQTYLATLHGFKISSGEIVELLHRASGQLHALVAALKQQIRASPAVQADETGWREDGKNGYIWSVSTPTIRYYEYHHSRGSEVVKQLLGDSFEGVLGSDFYASYNIYQGPHQRCWVHLLGDGHDLKEQYPDDMALQQWLRDLKALYQRAVAYAGPDACLPPAKQQAARRQQQLAYEQELMQVCAPYVHGGSHAYFV